MQNLLCPLRAADLPGSGPPGQRTSWEKTLTLAQRVFLVLVIKPIPQGLSGGSHHIENPTLHVEGHDTRLQLFPT